MKVRLDTYYWQRVTLPFGDGTRVGNVPNVFLVPFSSVEQIWGMSHYNDISYEMILLLWKKRKHTSVSIPLSKYVFSRYIAFSQVIAMIWHDISPWKLK